MPSPPEIVEGLGRIAEEGFGYAVAWHLVVAVLLAGVLAGWHPSKRLSAFLLVAPVASAAAFAWLYGNAFNGGVLSGVALLAWLAAWRSPDERIETPPEWGRFLGGVLVAFAWVYPHFLEGRSPLAYLAGAPMGLIPCPSLALAIGLALLTGAPGGRRQAQVLGAAGLFYALFGAVRLGVWMDLVLLAGAAGLLVARSAGVSKNVPQPAR